MVRFVICPDINNPSSINTVSEMATSTHTEDNESRIREGFICPICMEDLATDDQLLLHFEEAHDTEEDKDVLQAFKGNNQFICFISMH